MELSIADNVVAWRTVQLSIFHIVMVSHDTWNWHWSEGLETVLGDYYCLKLSS